MTGFDLGDPAPDADEEPDDEQADDETPSETTAEEPEPDPEPEPEPEPASEPEQTEESQSNDDSDQERDPTETGPAFPYSEVKQSPLYAREETWTEFDDQIDTTVVPELRQMGIRDDELREIHTAALEIVLENIEEIPERLAENRRQSE